MNDVQRVRLPLIPKVRGDCLPGGLNEARPCPYQTCYWHLKHKKESCVLDVADRGEATLEEVADFFGLTRERVRQLEAKMLKALKRSTLREFAKP